jgi:hypothetical protein
MDEDLEGLSREQLPAAPRRADELDGQEPAGGLAVGGQSAAPSVVSIRRSGTSQIVATAA